MAQFRLAAHVIGRSSGRSAVGAAAYRAAARLVDEASGAVHDYRRKGGVEHSEILAPENAPEWMRNRAALWNAVEKAEKRVDAQLVREIQLSLPHELSPEQRIALVRGFVKEAFVARGMIADLAIHAPSPAGDERNHHAHLLLTMRTLTGGGFGKKERAWNEAGLLEQWREDWAAHQNRAFAELGIGARVSHKTLLDQGIEREPQKHLGPIANEIERSGRASHRGDENREIARRNGARIDLETAANDIGTALDFEQRKFRAWAAKKRDQLAFDEQSRRAHFEVGLNVRMTKLHEALRAEFEPQKEEFRRAHEGIERRLEATGWRKFVRDITLRTRADKRALEAVEREAAEIAKAEAEKRGHAAFAEENRRRLLEQSEAKRAADLERGIGKAEAQRSAEGWQTRKERIRPGFSDSVGTALPNVREEFNAAARRGAHEESGGAGASGGKAPPPADQPMQPFARPGSSSSRAASGGLSEDAIEAYVREQQRAAQEAAARRGARRKPPG